MENSLLVIFGEIWPNTLYFIIIVIITTANITIILIVIAISITSQKYITRREKCKFQVDYL